MTSVAARARAIHRPRLAATLLTGVIVYYLILGLVILRPEAVYSGDIGVKYVQAHSLVDQKLRSLDIPYPGEFLDPGRQFFPLRPPFVMSVNATTQGIFPPASSLVQAAGVAVADFRGMILITLVSAALVLYSARRLSSQDDEAAVVVALGLASPLWFYAVSGWEHATAVAFGTLSFALALTSPSRYAPLVAGVALGIGAAIRDEVILLAPGLALAVWSRTRSPRAIAGAVGGIVVPLLLAMVLEVVWFERPAAAHVRHAVHILQTALNLTDAANPDVPVLQPMTLRQRYETVVQYWLLGYGIDRWIIPLTVLGAIALAVCWTTKSFVAALVWLAAPVVLALLDAYELVTAPKWLAGLHRVAPYLVFALLPQPRGTRTHDGFHGVLLFTTAIYLILAFIGTDTHGGKSLGPRLLMPLLPLLAVSSVMRIGAWVRSPFKVEKWIGYVGLLLISLSTVMHLAGTTRAYYWRNREDATALVSLASSRVKVVVTDDMYTAQLLLPLYHRKIIFLADRPELAAELGSLLNRARTAEAAVVSRQPAPSLSIAPLRLERSEQHGRMQVQYWRR